MNDLDLVEDMRNKYRASYDPDKPLTHMPFGRFKGSQIQELPTYYLSWLLHQDATRPNLMTPVAKVLKERYDREKATRSNQLNDNAIGD